MGGTNQSTLIIQDKTSSQILGVVLPSKHGDKPKKGSSVALFFRKFYHLSFIRLQDLCKNLTIEDEILRKIWTCFQQAIQNNLEELMKARHLDQIIMCIVYVVSKVRVIISIIKLLYDIMLLVYAGCGVGTKFYRDYAVLPTSATISFSRLQKRDAFGCWETNRKSWRSHQVLQHHFYQWYSKVCTKVLEQICKSP